METKDCDYTVATFKKCARILPTRNGNPACGLKCGISGCCARILPTRNGNPSRNTNTPKCLVHGSYLQGMETRLRRLCYLSVKLHGSYLQGMETINFEDSLVSLYNARILPTRNGNHQWRYRLKHLHPISTDPTYKEWKPTNLKPLLSFCWGTDPTYKEWKLGNEEFTVISGQKARILPTRNGNQPKGAGRYKAYVSTDPTYKEWKRTFRYLLRQRRLWHGSYLQGMETSLSYADGNILKDARILPTRNGN